MERQKNPSEYNAAIANPYPVEKGILKNTLQPGFQIDYSNQTLKEDEIAQQMLEKRSITDSLLISDDAEIERQERLYTMLRTSSKYKRLQVTCSNRSKRLIPSLNPWQSIVIPPVIMIYLRN